jgi:undecaprenyl-diphosphatase
MPTDLSIPQALLLSLVQGLTEFLPISSKTHLLFARHFLHLPEDIFFDVMLHVGSLGAILVYYRKTWFQLLAERRPEILRLVLGSIPLAFAGFLLRKRMEVYYENLLLASGMLLVTAAWLFCSERFSREKSGLLEAPLWKIFLIGLAQACAVFPGISRSGSTIGMGYLAGLRRTEAVRFSFFLGAIGISGAGLLEGIHAVKSKAPIHLAPILIGIAVTFLVSWAAIRVVEKLSFKGGFYAFAIYCAMAGVAGLIFFSRG